MLLKYLLLSNKCPTSHPQTSQGGSWHSSCSQTHLWKEHRTPLLHRRKWTRRGPCSKPRGVTGMAKAGPWVSPTLSLCHFMRRETPLTCPANNPQTPIIHRMLNTAEPTMVPTPTSPWVMNTPGKKEAQTSCASPGLHLPQTLAGSVSPVPSMDRTCSYHQGTPKMLVRRTKPDMEESLGPATPVLPCGEQL